MDEWLKTLGTLLGGGVLLGVVQAVLNHKQKGSRESYDEWAKIVKTQREELTDARARIAALEAARDVCNQEVARLSLEIHGMRSVVTRIGAGNIGAMIQCNDSGIITEWNPAATALFHWPREKALGMNVVELVAPRLRPAHTEGFTKRVKAGGRPTFDSLDTYGVTAEGEEFPCTVLLNTWTFEGERTYGAEVRPR